MKADKYAWGKFYNLCDKEKAFKAFKHVVAYKHHTLYIFMEKLYIYEFR